MDENDIKHDTMLVWTVEGEPVVGTFEEYVRDTENAHYSGMSISQFLYLFSDNWRTPLVLSPNSRYDCTDENDYMHSEWTLAKLSVWSRIDGRA